MAITTLDGYIAALKQYGIWNRTASRTTVANIPFALFDIAGNPGAGTLAVGNTANGIVPTDAIAGYPQINTIIGQGYLSRVIFSNTVLCRLAIYDRVFSAGAYAFNANTTLASQPSYAARILNADYKGLELWLEAVTAFTGSQSIRIQYLDQDGNAGDTGTVATGVAPTVGRMFRMPLASGDSGVLRVNVVTSTVSSAGTFNVHVMRKLWEGRVPVANYSEIHDFIKTGLPVVFDTSALFTMMIADSTSSGLPVCDFEIAQG